MEEELLNETQKNEKDTIILNLGRMIKESFDIIKICNTDQTIAFMNDTGYKFYGKSENEVKGKRCYDTFYENEKCLDCSFKEVIETKKKVHMEKYFPQHNRYMDVCFSPVLNKYGDIEYIIERLSDITDKKVLNNLLKESEKKYHTIVDDFPDAVIVIQDNKVALVNDEACKFIGVEYDAIVGQSLYKFIPANYIKSIHKTIRMILANKSKKFINDYAFNCSGTESVYVQVSSNYIIYQNKPAILSVIRDVSKMNKELVRAARLQKKTLDESFLPWQKFKIEAVYVPAKTVSGDFFRVYKFDDNLAVGIIFDVSGKGIAAALNVYAFDVLFLEEVLVNRDVMEIINNLNKKINSYFGESNVAACCFSMNFDRNEAEIVGAGINQYIFKRNDGRIEERVVRGASLGMFENSAFEKEVVNFEKGDVFFFFTDGLDFILDDDKVIQHYLERVNTTKFINYMNEYLNDTLAENGILDDDSTLLSLEIK